MNYDFGTKNRWRKQIWNVITARLQKPAAHSTVLYLPGPEDIDKGEMIARGFNQNNLIGIERNVKTAQSLRSQGRLCVIGDALKVIKVWPDSLVVDVVFLDLTGPISDDLIDLLCKMLAKDNMRHAIFAFNNMRGRETDQEIYAGFNKLVINCSDMPHRWERFFVLLANRDGYKPTRRFMERLCPYFTTYVSDSGQRFDSCVFSSWSSLGPTGKTFINNEIGMADNVKNKIGPFGTTYPSISRQITAVLANRTRRMAPGFRRTMDNWNKSYFKYDQYSELREELQEQVESPPIKPYRTLVLIKNKFDALTAKMKNEKQRGRISAMDYKDILKYIRLNLIRGQTT